MNLLTNKYFHTYKQHLPTGISSALQGIDALELAPHSFTFYTSVAVISSSRIEGEQMEADSYVKHKTQGVEYLPGLVEQPNDLESLSHPLPRSYRLDTSFAVVIVKGKFW